MYQRILAVALLFLSSHTFAQNLEAILSDTRLPVPIYGMSIVYDGQDSIYVLGGNRLNGFYQKDILKFSVTTQTLQKALTMDPVAFGTAVWADNQNILYFGGHDGSQWQAKIFSYKPDGTNDWTQIGDLPSKAVYTSSVWDQGKYSYVFGGLGSTSRLNTISRFSSVTNTSVVVGELPGPRDGTSAVWDETTGDAYVFGGLSSGERLNDIVKFNPAEDNSVVTLNATLPVATYDSCAIWTGTEAYIIGGKNSGQTFVRFNPSTNEVLNVPVNNLPDISGHGCAFVAKLNRIYVLGGSTGHGLRDEILYIDLGPSPTTPTTTTPMTTTKGPGTPTDCSDAVDGTRFPDPYCCKNFYQCQNQEAILRQCPSQLHFNPLHEECDLPEIVKCRSAYE